MWELLGSNPIFKMAKYQIFKRNSMWLVPGLVLFLFDIQV
jgi:hypothetical protein